jgi:mRNA deadenylase 3'-5' endonuclease subunit Ccr4
LFESRAKQVVDMLLNSEADLICLQEVGKFTLLNDELTKAGFVGTHKKRSLSENARVVDGLAFFYRQSRYCFVFVIH